MQIILKKSKYQDQYLKYLPKKTSSYFLVPTSPFGGTIQHKSIQEEKKKVYHLGLKKYSLWFFKSLDFKELSYNIPQITLKDKLKKQAIHYISLSILDESSLERNERRTTETANNSVYGVSSRNGLMPFPCPTTYRALEEGYGRII